MSEEHSIFERIEEHPSFDLEKVREVRPVHLAYRFIAGALTSIASGGATLLFGARVGGVFLAFPAILAASLTLIEQKENATEAREDARGAVVGALALALFAAVTVVTVDSVAGAIALALATVTWFLGAVLGYLLAWFR